MKKKIVYVAQSAGGVAQYLYMLLNNMQQEKYENILIISEDYKEQIERFKKIVNQIYIVPMIREISPKKDLKAILKIKKLLKQIKPDIVYLHSSKAGAIGRIALLFNKKVKILYNAHGWYFNAKIGEKKKKLFIIIEKILALKTNKIINISKNEYDSAIQYKIAKPRKMCIIENGIDFVEFQDVHKNRQKIRKKYHIEEDQTVIGVVGRLAEQKDPITSIKAFRLVHEQNQKTKFMFIGSGELEKKILEYARQNEIQNDMIITGWTKEVQKYIPALDIAILPSKWEGFGLVLIEYMACDKPIIASKVGGIANIIKDGENGYLIDIEDVETLANKINFLINNKEKQNYFIENNKKSRKKYDIKNVVNQHLKLIEENLNE